MGDGRTCKVNDDLAEMNSRREGRRERNRRRGCARKIRCDCVGQLDARRSASTASSRQGPRRAWWPAVCRPPGVSHGLGHHRGGGESAGFDVPRHRARGAQLEVARERYRRVKWPRGITDAREGRRRRDAVRGCTPAAMTRSAVPARDSRRRRGGCEREARGLPEARCQLRRGAAVSNTSKHPIGTSSPPYRPSGPSSWPCNSSRGAVMRLSKSSHVDTTQDGRNRHCRR